MNTAKSTWRRQAVNVQLMRMGIGSSMLLNVAFGFALITQPASVVLIPPYTHEKIEFIEGRANAEYYQQWAWSVAMLVGNIDPSNVEFVQNELQRIATTGLFKKMEDVIAASIADVIRDKAVIRFTPKQVLYDPELDLHFVTGTQILSGPVGRDVGQRQVTYEMAFVTERLRIQLSELRVYHDKPMTSEVRAALLAKQEQE